jgi:hypothetical protein
MQAACNSYSIKSKRPGYACSRTQTSRWSGDTCANIAGTISAGDHSMPLITNLLDGLFGLTALSSLAGFVFHLLTGNPDMALLCFVGIGGSAAIGWMFTTCRSA